MRIERTMVRRRRLSLTSLIDVIFLLLLFFMLSSTFSRFSEVRFAGGTSGGSAGQRPDVILSLAGGTVRLNGMATERDGIADGLSRLKESGASNVLLTFSDETSTEDLVTVMQAVSRTGLPVSVARSGP
ncbi:MAG: biopolymer transporter ExbD [Phyllobacteriaceae bacterium]|nr:biopolymer transporter ExbD [Phyllobacteriaceae bacterium]